MTINTENTHRARTTQYFASTFAAAVCICSSSFAFATAPPTQAERLERLTERLEEARVEQRIPGVAIAIVQDDALIYAKGFGLANVENNTPVDTHTQFAIGSTTKAFTSAAIAMLVDDGVMTWDDPATKWLPAFHPPIEAVEGEVLTIRDMLCHRSGFTRMSMLWAGGAVPRAQMLEIANDAEPWAPFREQFLYNNIMYMAAGMAAGEADGSSWESLMRERIFAPLGMERANLTMAEAEATGQLALGYAWKNEAFEHVPMRNIDLIGPAGSINADVLDMAQWLRLQLGKGEFEGTQLISEENLFETWTPQITIGGDLKYGLGWMLHDWDGHELVEHGGNIDGFAAQVAMLPEENIGFVLLTNTGFSSLQSGSIDLVFEALLGDWEIETDDAHEELNDDEPRNETDLASVAGVYIANYATFNNEKFTVAVSDTNEITIDIPSQQVFTLTAPGDDGRRPFEGAPQIAAAFETDEDGEVVMLVLYQGGLRFEVPREGYAFPIEVPLAKLNTYVGEYFFEPMNDNMTVLVRNNHLAVDVPNQMVFELHTPDDDGKWQFRSNDAMKIAVSFQEDAFGEVESMTLFQGGQEFVMPRVATPSADDLPTIDEVVALAQLNERQAILESITPMRLTGTARFAQSGIKGTSKLSFDSGDRASSLIDLGPFGTIRTVLDGDKAWSDSSMSGVEELAGRQYEAARRDHPVVFLGDWRRLYSSFRVTGRRTERDRSVILVEVATDDAPGATLSIDEQTGDILRLDTVKEVPSLGNAKIPVTTHFDGWVTHRGLRMPTIITAETQQNGRFIIEVTGRATKIELESDAFNIED